MDTFKKNLQEYESMQKTIDYFAQYENPNNPSVKLYDTFRSYKGSVPINIFLEYCLEDGKNMSSSIELCGKDNNLIPNYDWLRELNKIVINRIIILKYFSKDILKILFTFHNIRRQDRTIRFFIPIIYVSEFINNIYKFYPQIIVRFEEFYENIIPQLQISKIFFKNTTIGVCVNETVEKLIFSNCIFLDSVYDLPKIVQLSIGQSKKLSDSKFNNCFEELPNILKLCPTINSLKVCLHNCQKSLIDVLTNNTQIVTLDLFSIAKDSNNKKYEMNIISNIIQNNTNIVTLILSSYLQTYNVPVKYISNNIEQIILINGWFDNNCVQTFMESTSCDVIYESLKIPHFDPPKIDFNPLIKYYTLNIARLIHEYNGWSFNKDLIKHSSCAIEIFQKNIQLIDICKKTDCIACIKNLRTMQTFFE